MGDSHDQPCLHTFLDTPLTLTLLGFTPFDPTYLLCVFLPRYAARGQVIGNAQVLLEGLFEIQAFVLGAQPTQQFDVWAITDHSS